ncbi:hypothetical protein [Sphingosinicella sp. BN140058]|uniref:hypothetical protein n=1 Tax=Sphingosinicella sp. BN140058 TaxID=1892855 RepID=UPI001010699E|nr:hypothetical protein [Sphingosinicella sp. BN140058]QAY80486.1 hypothetical protein ETR14_28005 [Sphingosinicella sp. BN140058]
MARAKTIAQQPAAPGAPRLHLRPKGPLSCAEIELTVYAAFSAGEFASTPETFSCRARAVPHLVTDKPTIAGILPHEHIIEVATAAEVQARLTQLRFSYPATVIDGRQASVAGSLDVIRAALPDAYRIVLFANDDDPSIGTVFKGWKISKPDKRSTPPTITLTRD